MQEIVSLLVENIQEGSKQTGEGLAEVLLLCFWHCISSRRSLTSALFVMMSVSAALTSLMVEPLVPLLGLRRISSHPAGAMKELRESLGFPVRGEGGRIGFRDGAE